MNLNEVKYIYFVGIGGIGMSAIARYFNLIGKKVAGYDKTPTTLTENLNKEGIEIHYDDNIELILPEIKQSENISKTIIIYTPAIPKEHTELIFFQKNGYKIVKRAEMLGIISRNDLTIAIAGTHGKTTTTTMTSHILLVAKMKCAAFLGGISKNYHSNLLISKLINNEFTNKELSLADKFEYIVVEADEFDRSFLQLNPQIAVITSCDADHLDIYGSKENVQQAFRDFTNRINSDGILLIKKGVDIQMEKYPVKTFTYSLELQADFYAKNIIIKQGKYNFDIVTPTKIMENITVGTTGKLNAENAIAAAAVAYLANVDENCIREALESFQGVERRFDFQIQHDHFVYIDDYAHHPEELKAFIKSVREIFPAKKITGIFQPHLYSRTKDFADEFAESLEYLDELILLEIYPARELPIEGINSKMLLDKVNLSEKYLCEKDKIIEFLSKKKLEVLLTLGAGDIDKLVKPIKEAFKDN